MKVNETSKIFGIHRVYAIIWVRSFLFFIFFLFITIFINFASSSTNWR